ncbi:MAG: hypothetical protein OEM26_14135 [Saprospiraceae bacterium]|nr:hypothetical protein [Saprospiraceae bacterium]
MITINFRNEMDLLIEQSPFILQNEFFSLEGVAADTTNNIQMNLTDPPHGPSQSNDCRMMT